MKAGTIRTKVLSLLLAAVMLLGLMPVGALAATVDGSYTPGTYTGTAQGYKGDVTVTVTLTESDGTVVISDITAVGESETPSCWADAITLLEQIKEKNGTDGVDAVSGATRSSNGIINATNEALGKATAEISGTGTQADPFVIMNAAALAKFAAEVDSGNTYAGQYVVLGADIDLSGVESWNPIGQEGKDSAAIFQGSFDGRGYSITGLKINTEISSEGNYGLFSVLGNQAVVKNVNVTGADMTVSNTADVARVGVIAGDTQKTAGSGDTGLAARIDHCSTSGTVSVTTTGDKLAFGGGVVGRLFNGGVVTNCWSDVNITSKALNGTKSAYAGGIAGTTGNFVVIANCATFGDCTAIAPKNTNFGGMAGGLTAMMAGKQYNSYATGDMTIGNGGTVNLWVGALDGQVTTSGTTGGTAYPEQGASRLHNYYAKDVVLKEEIYTDNGNTLSETKTLDTVDRGSGKVSYDKVMVSTEMTKETMASADFVSTLNANIKEINGILAAYGITGIALREWQLSGGRVLPTGSVWVSGDIDASIFASGDGSEENPYIIANATQLRAFADSMNDKIDYSGKFVALGADIDVSDAEWRPIGGSEYAFNGTFDGNGHTVSGLRIGTEEAPYALGKEDLYIGLFGVLGSSAYVKDVSVSVAFYTSYEASAYVGGIAGYTDGVRTSGDFSGAVIDGCRVTGTIKHISDKGNQFVGGIVGMQYKGAVINSSAEVKVSGIVKAGDLAEVGGLVGLNNRGLVANCFSDSDVYGSGNRENGNEGMAVVSSLVACNAGSLVNCYAAGNVETEEHSTYAGMVSGWVTGIGKSYSCLFDLNGTMTLKVGDANPQPVKPVESIGTKVASGVNDEGDAYTGGLVDKMTGVNGASKEAADTLNSSFAAFPIDITVYGVSNDSLRKWVYDSDAKTLAVGGENASVTYVQPECEKIVKPELKLMDGTWYGRDDNKLSVVSIEVKDGEITATKVISGQSEGEAYDAALAKAKYKATYGDFSTYEAANPSKFAGGSGTEADPYLIANEAQLRYLSSSINADVSWKGVYFKQTADITLSDADWLSIGWALNGEVNGKKTSICTYPFRGNYDGGGYTIYNLTVGSKDAPSDQMTSGLFGLAAGEVSTNDLPTADQQTVTIKNVNLKDIDINVSTRYETYSGGLVGSGQGGIYIDNCTVQGVMNITTSESFCRAGGLAGSVLRGSVTNCGADVDITAVTDTSHVYAGGLYGMDNRVTTYNCYALGDVTGNSTNNNKVHIGGLVGQGGGIHYNCYVSGDVVSLKSTSDAGALNGRSAGINIDYYCYYNTDAVVKQGDIEENKAIGVITVNAFTEELVGKTAAELKSADFASLMSDNASEEKTAKANDAVNKALAENGSGLVQANYYNGTKLLAWSADGGCVTFKTAYVNPFADVAKDSYYYDAVMWAAENKITNGMTLNTFGPESECTRGQIVTMLYRAAGSPKVDDVDNPFTDVAKDSYYYDAVMWAVKNGITDGIGNNKFAPNAVCTRAQIVTFLWRANDKPVSTVSVGFTDVTQDWYKGAVAWAVENNVTNGIGNNMFAPDNTCTRAQAVTFIYRAK